LLQECDAFLASEVAVAFEGVDADPLRGGNASARGSLAFVDEVDTELAVVLAEEVGVAVLVAGGDEFLELEVVELAGEVVKEVADLGVIAVAQDSLALEVLRVVLEFLLDVGKLGLELILLCRLRGVQASIQRLARHSSRFPSF
jgi:hypothetical protein